VDSLGIVGRRSMLTEEPALPVMPVKQAAKPKGSPKTKPKVVPKKRPKPGGVSRP